MKTISVLFALSTLLGVSAHANTFAYRQQANNGVDVTGVAYAINAPLGRAWIKVELYDRSCSGGDDCSPAGEERAKVEGLTYDRASEQVIYTEAGSAPVVCAKVVHHKFIAKWATVEATGNCGLIKGAPQRLVTDDGYETRETVYSTYFFGKVSLRAGN